ncbi:MAG: hypothetical protein HY248_02350 [Fimbriimonas ginsengisoli]|nr:hypothetical protein [Fimbriimonas ginsengisoli]
MRESEGSGEGGGGEDDPGRFADVIAYARGEFKDGRSEREVVRLLMKMGHPAAIRGLVHEVYYDTLGVSDNDRAIEFLFRILSLPLFFWLLFQLHQAWWTIPLVLALFGAYIAFECWAMRRFWEWRRRWRERSDQ